MADGVRWHRLTNRHSGGSAYVVKNAAGVVVIHVHKKHYCQSWFVYFGEEQDEADGIRFEYLWEAKAYAERQIARGRVTLGGEATAGQGARPDS